MIQSWVFDMWPLNMYAEQNKAHYKNELRHVLELQICLGIKLGEAS